MAIGECRVVLLKSEVLVDVEPTTRTPPKAAVNSPLPAGLPGLNSGFKGTLRSPD
jgi:hypothetical protein